VFKDLTILLFTNSKLLCYNFTAHNRNIFQPFTYHTMLMSVVLCKRFVVCGGAFSTVQ